MGSRETSLGGPTRGFHTTIWSDIRAATDPTSPACREKLGQLLQTYWKPVYAYIRRGWHRNIEESKDLTQAFFAMLLEKGHLARANQEKGSFRAYLKRALRNFLINAQEASAVRRRRRPLVSLDAPSSELERIGLTAAAETPEEAYDHEWFRTLFESAIEDLKKRLEREGKPLYFEVFQTYCFEDASTADDTAGPKEGGTPTYRELAERLGIKDTDVRNYLTYCRRAIRESLRVRIREYVASDADVDRELLRGTQGAG